MGNFGWTEMFFIVAFALIVFGPRKLPEIAKTLGHAMAQLRRASEEFKRTWEVEVDRETTKIQQPKLPADATTNQSDINSNETPIVASNTVDEISAGMPDNTPVEEVTVNIARGRLYNDIIPEPEANPHPSLLGTPDSSTAEQSFKSDEKHPVSIA